MKLFSKTYLFFIASALLISQNLALGQSGSIGGGFLKTPDGETFNAIGKGYKSKSDSCNAAKENATTHAKRVRAIDFSFGSCDCTDRKLESSELYFARAMDSSIAITRENVSEYICNVDVRITYK